VVVAFDLALLLLLLPLLPVLKTVGVVIAAGAEAIEDGFDMSSAFCLIIIPLSSLNISSSSESSEPGLLSTAMMASLSMRSSVFAPRIMLASAS